MRNPSGSVLLLAALAMAPAARGGFLDLAAQSGPIQLLWSTPPINWGAGTVVGSFTISSPNLDPGASVWLVDGNTVGLTNTLFTCTDPAGCPAFTFSFTALGWDQWPATFTLSGSHTHTGDVQAQYYINVTGPVSCPVLNPLGVLLLPATFSEEGPLIQCSPAYYYNTQFLFSLTPAGGGVFAEGTTLVLPDSFALRGVVPEPGTATLAALGILGLLAARRAWRKA